MNFGYDYSVFSQGLPVRSTAGPSMDLTLSLVTDPRLVLVMDLFKMQSTPPELLWWSRLPTGPNQAYEPNPVTVNLGDMLGDSVDDRTLAQLASDLEILITNDPRFVEAEVSVTYEGTTLIVVETVLPADGSLPVQLVLSADGGRVTIVSLNA